MHSWVCRKYSSSECTANDWFQGPNQQLCLYFWLQKISGREYEQAGKGGLPSPYLQCSWNVKCLRAVLVLGQAGTSCDALCTSETLLCLLLSELSGFVCWAKWLSTPWKSESKYTPSLSPSLTITNQRGDLLAKMKQLQCHRPSKGSGRNAVVFKDPLGRSLGKMS